MIEWIFTLLVVYLLYKLIFDFILPVSKASAQMRNKIKEMHQPQNTDQQKSAPGTTSRPPAEDYIDFEEIKTPNP
jgi:hypothetical protein